MFLLASLEGASCVDGRTPDCSIPDAQCGHVPFDGALPDVEDEDASHVEVDDRRDGQTGTPSSDARADADDDASDAGDAESAAALDAAEG